MIGVVGAINVVARRQRHGASRGQGAHLGGPRVVLGSCAGSGGAGPRDAAEAAFWVALDFVPDGTGVKLGIRVAQAIRGPLKSSGRG